MLSPQHMQCIKPRHVGQMVVEQHHIKIGVFKGQFKRTCAVCRLQNQHFIIQHLEHLAQAFAYQGMIINDKNFYATHD